MMLRNITLLQLASICWVIDSLIAQCRANVGPTTVDQLLMLNCWVSVGPMSVRQY